ncbi:MAG: TlyA family RNA methyltransferase, partial [Oscillospiraceae bacterium]
EGDNVSIVGEQLRYVGRGGLKLEKALTEFGIVLDGALCVDIGASTGGFTDCMLQNGASLVFAVDVGTNQLDEKLRRDDRVVSLEQTDIRSFEFSQYAERLPENFEGADFVGTDVSFISLKAILPHIHRLLRNGAVAAALIKPQFEAATALCAGKSAIGKNGIVRDEKTRRKIVEEIRDFAQQCGFTVGGIVESPIKGGSGNTEYLMYLRKG